jgi:sugar phosphate isomerase/epimerase
MKTSVSLFSSDILQHKRKLYHKVVKNKIINAHDVDGTFTQLKKAGIDGIEICLSQFTKTKEEDIAEINALTQKHNLPVLSVHQVIRFITATKLPEIEQLVQIAKKLSATLVVLHTSSARNQIFKQSYIDAIHALEKKYGITVTFENMERTLLRRRKKHTWDVNHFPELMKKNNLNVTLDIVHLAHSGGDIISFFKQHHTMIKNIHLSDYRFNKLNSTLRPLRYKHMPLGEGELPIAAFLQVLREKQYKGLVTMEIHTDLAGIMNGAKIINAYK